MPAEESVLKCICYREAIYGMSLVYLVAAGRASAEQAWFMFAV
jgi:hypothetical protein